MPRSKSLRQSVLWQGSSGPWLRQCERSRWRSSRFVIRCRTAMRLSIWRRQGARPWRLLCWRPGPGHLRKRLPLPTAREPKQSCAGSRRVRSSREMPGALWTLYPANFRQGTGLLTVQHHRVWSVPWLPTWFRFDSLAVPQRRCHLANTILLMDRWSINRQAALMTAGRN